MPRIFTKHGSDHCNDAQMMLDELCREKRLDPLILMAELNRISRPSLCELGTDWGVAPLAELRRHMEEKHHAFCQRELPRLATPSSKVAAAFIRSHPETRELDEALQRFQARLESHIEREQAELFPAIRRLMELEPPAEPPDIAALIDFLEEDHDAVDAELLRIRHLTHGLVAPPDGC